MSQNIEQIYIANPASSMVSTDLLYLGRSPYNTTDDFAITFTDFVGSIGTATPTASTISKWDSHANMSAVNFIPSFTTTATAAGNTILTVASTYFQYFTGSTTQTVTMPVTSGLVQGQSWMIVNNSSGNVTINSSGGNAIQVLAANTSAIVTCQLTSGTSAASWNCTYIQDAGFTPAALTEVNDTNVTLTLGGTPTTALLQAVSLTLGWTGQLAVARGGTGVASVTTAPTATSFAGWDANSNLSANSFIQGFATTATAAATTTLVVGDKEIQEFTGSTTQTVVMPVTSTLVAGQQYYIINNSSGVVTVQSSGANTIQAMAAGTSLLLTCVLTSGTTAASWQASYVTDAGGTVNIGTANQTAYYSTAGNAVSGVGPGSAGQLYQSAGAGSPPAFTTATYPSTNSLSGSILRGNGTNWLQSSFTIPDTFATNDMIYCSSTNNLSAISTANSSFLVTSAGGVPSFGKTYLEGTWTPTLVSSGGGAPTYTLQQAAYTQIGNRVMFNINLVLATTGTLAAGTLTITGLPVAASASVALATAFQSLSAGTVTATAAYTNNASTAIALYKFNAGSLTALADTDLQGTSQFIISGTYIV